MANPYQDLLRMREEQRRALEAQGNSMFASIPEDPYTLQGATEAQLGGQFVDPRGAVEYATSEPLRNWMSTNSPDMYDSAEDHRQAMILSGFAGAMSEGDDPVSKMYQEQYGTSRPSQDDAVGMAMEKSREVMNQGTREAHQKTMAAFGSPENYQLVLDSLEPEDKPTSWQEGAELAATVQTASAAQPQSGLQQALGRARGLPEGGYGASELLDLESEPAPQDSIQFTDTKPRGPLENVAFLSSKPQEEEQPPGPWHEPVPWYEAPPLEGDPLAFTPRELASMESRAQIESGEGLTRITERELASYVSSGHMTPDEAERYSKETRDARSGSGPWRLGPSRSWTSPYQEKPALQHALDRMRQETPPPEQDSIGEIGASTGGGARVPFMGTSMPMSMFMGSTPGAGATETGSSDGLYPMPLERFVPETGLAEAAQLEDDEGRFDIQSAMTPRVDGKGKAAVTLEDGTKVFYGYKDTEGYITIGAGFNLDQEGAANILMNAGIPKDLEELKSGEEYITEEESHRIFLSMLPDKVALAKRWVGQDVWDKLTKDRQQVLLNMSFNMKLGKAGAGKGKPGGITSLPRLLKQAVENDDQSKYDAAAERMLTYLWADQVGPRAERLSDRMRGTSSTGMARGVRGNYMTLAQGGDPSSMFGQEPLRLDTSLPNTFPPDDIFGTI